MMVQGGVSCVSRPVWTKVGEPSEDCVLSHHAKLKIQRYFWSLETMAEEY